MNREGIEGLRQCLLADEEVREMIAMRAYELFVNRGQVHGYDQQDWHQAENEILSKLIAGELAVSDTRVNVSVTARQAHPTSLTARKPRTRKVKANEVKVATKAKARKSTSPKTKAVTVVAIMKKPTDKILAAGTDSTPGKKSASTAKSRKAKVDASQTTAL
jgi:hypothetical protein